VDGGQSFDEVEKERLPETDRASFGPALAKSVSVKPRARAPQTVAARHARAQT
jgi:hypothetical protein